MASSIDVRCDTPPVQIRVASTSSSLSVSPEHRRPTSTLMAVDQWTCKGCEPEWNETFVFTVSDGATELFIKLLDSGSGTDDDFVGEATILVIKVSEDSLAWLEERSRLIRSRSLDVLLQFISDSDRAFTM
ncbi:unnamed protein product [Miscanthus lutarioriparius]|uniref:C2 domain-containing protein n=1 Tax=Miscanthus lutarioriparius TaxID=422564 RepID=A0A811N8L8_9POAL|nr:unnamed protein product [Miscanthus lutarioriparius]